MNLGVAFKETLTLKHRLIPSLLDSENKSSLREAADLPDGKTADLN